MSTEEYHALWRSSAHEAVPYTDDFPEALLVLPELCDGSIGQGNATRITIRIDLNGDDSKLTVSDNGGGIRNERRLLAWAASKATSNIHRNGHGTKKCLTKWEPDYEKAKWTIRWRLPGKNLQTTMGPFKGYSPDSVVDDEGEDTNTLMPSGCEISIWFSATSILTDRLANNPDGVYTAIREIIQTRYSEETLSKTEFILDISHPSSPKLLSRSSRKEKWHSFKTCVEEAVKSGVAKNRHSSTYEFDGGYYRIDIYSIEGDGKRKFKLKDEFPTYGHKNMKCSRVHISIDGRTIEAKHVSLIMDRENHNRFNGFIPFVQFIPNSKGDYAKLPIPCTTKVSMYVNDKVFMDFEKKFTEIFPAIVREVEAEVEKRLEDKKTVKADPSVVPLDVVVSKKQAPVPVPPSAPVTSRTPVAPPAPVVAPPAPVVAHPAPVVAHPAPVVAPPAPVVAPPIPVAPVLPSPPTITPLPPRSVTPVGGHNRLNGCSRQNLFDLLIHFKEKIVNLPLQTLRENAPATTEPGLAQKIQALREILESI
jgi:hypothetical protein